MAKLLVPLLVILAAHFSFAQYGMDLGSFVDGGVNLVLPKEMPKTLTKGDRELLKTIGGADTFPYFEELRYLAEDNVTLSTRCGDDYLTILSGIWNEIPFALQMLDSIGKPSAGILKLNIFWMGMYKQCTKTIAMNGTQEMFHGKYCKSTIGNFTYPVKLGLCFPDSCSTSDVQIISDAGLKLLTKGKLYSAKSSCVEDFPWTTGDIVALVVCGILVWCVVVGTLYDIVIQNNPKERKKRSTGHEIELKSAPHNSNRKEGKHQFVSTISQEDTMATLERGSSRSSVVITHSTLELVPDKSEEPTENKQRKPRQPISHRLLVGFSALTNATKLFNLRKNPEAMDCLNGMRAISITWIVLGHTYNFSSFYVNNLGDWGDMMAKFTFQIIIATFYGVDTFFFISGFLVTIGTLNLLHKGRMNWPMFYIHRYVRLTPVYAVTLMLFCTLFLHLLDGPFNDDVMTTGPLIEKCYDNWWSNLIYINNFIPPERLGQCMGWTWYLANDMQFFIVSPIFIFALHKKRLVGWLLIGLMWLSCVLLNGIIAYIEDVPVGNLSDLTFSPYLDYMYRQPYYRIAPYLIGMALGDIIFHIKKDKRRVRIPGGLNMFLWVIAISLNLTMFYSQYSLYHNRIQWETTIASIYYALSKSIWSISLFYVVFACITGHGGPINWLLSWRIWQPFARLSYATYLIHPMVIYWYYGNAQMPLNSNDYNYMYWFLGHMGMSFSCGLALSLFVEAPFMRLENVVFGR